MCQIILLDIYKASIVQQQEHEQDGARWLFCSHHRSAMGHGGVGCVLFAVYCFGLVFVVVCEKIFADFCCSY